MSWDESFADRYEEWSAPMTADIAFYAGLARAADGPLVKLAIGNGRVAIPVAQATGKPVIGIDSSPVMLAKARAGAAKAGVRLDLREGDMRDLALDEPAGLIYCPYRGGTSSLWWATKNEWLGLLDVAGLEVAALYGGFAGEPFTDESHEYVFVARHRRATG